MCRYEEEDRALVQALHDHGHALAAADAHRLEAEGVVRVLQAVEQRGHDAGAGHPERVAEGDRPAVDVELLLGDAEVPGRGDHLGGERLVDLDEVDVVDGHSGAGERLAARLDRPEAHDLRVQARHARRHHPGDRGDTEVTRHLVEW